MAKLQAPFIITSEFSFVFRCIQTVLDSRSVRWVEVFREGCLTMSVLAQSALGDPETTMGKEI